MEALYMTLMLAFATVSAVCGIICYIQDEVINKDHAEEKKD